VTTSTPTSPACCATRPRRRKSPPPPSSAPTASATASTPSGESRALGCSASPATPPSTSCAEPADLESFGAAEGAEHDERRLTVAAALERLEPRERELIALKFFAGLANAEIAQVIGLSESNAGTKLHRAMTKLREACDGNA